MPTSRRGRRHVTQPAEWATPPLDESSFDAALRLQCNRTRVHEGHTCHGPLIAVGSSAVVESASHWRSVGAAEGTAKGTANAVIQMSRWEDGSPDRGVSCRPKPNGCGSGWSRICDHRVLPVRRLTDVVRYTVGRPQIRVEGAVALVLLGNVEPRSSRQPDLILLHARSSRSMFRAKALLAEFVAVAVPTDSTKYGGGW